MPVMNGIDLTSALGKLDSEQGEKPAIIIALTGLDPSSIR
jgi:hypothetical protein